MATGSFDSNNSTPAVTAVNYSSGLGVSAQSTGGTAVYGVGNTGVLGNGNVGARGNGLGTGAIGVKGDGSNYTSATGGDFECTGSGSCGVYASGASYGLYCNGNLWATSYLNKPGGGFVVDHPNMPDTHLLNHEFCESPKAQNLYRGTITLDANGNGIAMLPDYYEATNTNGAAFVNGAKAGKIVGGKFSVTKGESNETVDWLVVADRNDPWQRMHGKPDVIAKVGHEVGRYAQPALYGKDDSFHMHDRVRAGSSKP